MKYILISFFLIFHLIISDPTSYNYSAYTYNAKSKKLVYEYFNRFKQLDHILNVKYPDAIQNFSGKVFSSSLTLSNILYVKSSFNDASWTNALQTPDMCFDQYTYDPALIFEYNVHYTFRFMNSVRSTGYALIRYTSNLVDLQRCYANESLFLNISGDAKVINGVSIKNNMSKLIEDTFHKFVRPNIVKLIFNDMQKTVYGTELNFINSQSFTVLTDIITINISLSNIAFFSNQFQEFYFSFQYNASIYSNKSPTPIPINNQAYTSYIVNQQNSSLICTNIHVALDVMNLIFDEYKYAIPLNTTSMGLGNISQNYFEIVPELSYYLNGNEAVTGNCTKNPLGKFYFPTEYPINYTMILPMICSFNILGFTHPFLEIPMNISASTNIDGDISSNGFKLVFTNGTLLDFISPNHLTPIGKMQLKNILNLAAQDLINLYFNGTSKWDWFRIPFPSPKFPLTFYEPRNYESCYYFI